MSTAQLRSVTVTAGDPSAALRGILFKVAAVGLISVMGALIKGLGDTYPTGQIVFVRSLFALIPVILLVLWSGGLRQLRTRRPWLHVSRSVTGFGAMLCSFAALGLLPLADATALGFVSPLMATALAGPLLGERVRLNRWAAVLVGFAGVILMVRPVGAVTGPSLYGFLPVGVCFALLGALGVALAMISIRRMSSTEPSITIVFYFTLTSTVLGALTLPFAAVLPTAKDAAVMVCIGLVGGIGQILLTNAYRLVPASALAPFDYMAMVWALVIGYVVFGEMPQPAVLVGAAIVIGSGLFLLIRGHSRNPRRLQAPAAAIGGRTAETAAATR